MSDYFRTRFDVKQRLAEQVPILTRLRCWLLLHDLTETHGELWRFSDGSPYAVLRHFRCSRCKRLKLRLDRL